MLRTCSTQERSDQVISTITASAAVCGLVMVLMLSGPPRAPMASSTQVALRVVWIERDVPQIESHELSAATEHAERQPAAAAVDLETTDAPDEGDEEVAAQVQRLDLSLPATPLGFHRDVFDRPTSPQKEALHRFSFQDRSLGGTLKEMARSSVCAELNRALAAEPGSQDAIENARRRHGCHRQH